MNDANSPIGYQIVHTETDDPPPGMHTYEIFRLEFCLAWIRAHDSRDWRLLPIYANSIDELVDWTDLDAEDAVGYDPSQKHTRLSAVPEAHLVRYRGRRAFVLVGAPRVGTFVDLLYEDAAMERFALVEEDPLVVDLGPGALRFAQQNEAKDKAEPEEEPEADPPRAAVTNEPGRFMFWKRVNDWLWVSGNYIISLGYQQRYEVRVRDATGLSWHQLDITNLEQAKTSAWEHYSAVLADQREEAAAPPAGPPLDALAWVWRELDPGVLWACCDYYIFRTLSGYELLRHNGEGLIWMTSETPSMRSAEDRARQHFIANALTRPSSWRQQLAEREAQ